LYSYKTYIPSEDSIRRQFLTKAFTSVVDSLNSFYCQIWFYLGSDFAVGANDYYEIICLGKTTGSVVKIKIKNSSGNIVLVSNVTGDGTTNLNKEQWYCLGIQFKLGTSGAGSLIVDLNGATELSTTSASFADTANTLDIGWIHTNASGTRGTIYFDDIIIDTSPIPYTTSDIKLLHPNLLGRIGSPLYVILTGWQNTDTLTVTLKSDEGYNRTLYNSIVSSGRIDLSINLRGLSIANYTITATLKNSGGATKATSVYTWYKGYDSDPVFSIDENSDFTLNGDKFFPVVDFCKGENYFASWKANGYINMTNGQGWGTQTLDSWLSYLDDAFDAGLYSWGPINLGQTHGVTITDTLIQSYISGAKDYPAQVAWNWVDEPELGTQGTVYTPSQYRNWFHLAKQYSPDKVTNLTLGASTASEDNEYQIELLHKWFQPQVADFYSLDVYPVGYQTG
jgi:hypothetical protein